MFYLNDSGYQELKRKFFQYENDAHREINDLYNDLHISQLNIKWFNKIQTINQWKITAKNCFDLYKLSKYFRIKAIQTDIKKFCNNNFSDIRKILSEIHNLLKDNYNLHNPYFYSFIEENDFTKKLSLSINDLFKKKYIDYFPIPVIIKILEKVQRIQIPSNELFKFILQSIDDRFVLLRFINFNFLTSFQISQEEFKKITIQMISQYDSCMRKLLSINNDNSEAIKLFNEESKKGNQIATFYSQSLLKEAAEINHSKPNEINSIKKSRRSNSVSNFRTKSNSTSLYEDKSSKQIDIKTTKNSPSKKEFVSSKSQAKIDTLHRPLTKDDQYRAKIWQKTDQIIQTGSYKLGDKIVPIENDVKRSIENTKTIKPDSDLNFIPAPQISTLTDRDKMKLLKRVSVVNKSTFAAARDLSQNDTNRVCVLNFASATQPGGGVVRGRGAQEETLSRMSSLYPTLTKDDEMYKHHKTQNSPLYSDYMIFSPDVVVFRDDDYKLIDKYHVSVISAAAVNCSQFKDEFKKSKKLRNYVKKLMMKRCRRIIQLCIAEHIKSIVLGAFGCGVFENSPDDVSSIFKEVLIDEGYGFYFDRIVFAILSPKDKPNYIIKQFQKAFAAE